MSRYYMLDTNTASYIVSGASPAARDKFLHLRAHEVACISSITEAELLYGLAKNPRAQAQRPFQALLSKIQVLSWGREEAAVYADLRVSQEKVGKTLQNLDLLIAAHALAVGATLVTNDKAFQMVPSLPLENWSTDIAP